MRCPYSVENGAGELGLAFGHSAATVSGYFIGDITGLFACLLVLMLAFMLLKLVNRT
jgi:asparagine N-glycosylation enzyme membrane subunit Stt3